MTTHTVITGGWLARTPDGATWAGYRVAQLTADDVFTYSGPGRDYGATRDHVHELETSGHVVWWQGSDAAPYGGTETHWTVSIRTPVVDSWRVTVTRGNSDTYAAPGYSWRASTWDGRPGFSGHADTLHGAMTDAADTVRDLSEHAV